MAAARKGSAFCRRFSPADAFSANSSRASTTLRAALSSASDAPAVAGVHSAATPRPAVAAPVSESESTTASHTRTAIMNSATSFSAASAAASATFCTSAEAELTRYTCADVNTSANVTSSAQATPAVVNPASSRNRANGSRASTARRRKTARNQPGTVPRRPGRHPSASFANSFPLIAATPRSMPQGRALPRPHRPT